MPYLIEYRDIESLLITDALKRISELDGIPLSDLKVKDLTWNNASLIYPGEGVYIFREGKQMRYVGKGTSMSFTERIPKHFDPRPKAWFNSLLKRVSQKHFDKPIVQPYNEEDEAQLKLTLDHVLRNFNLVLIQFSDRDKINRIERLFRDHGKPYNCFKFKSGSDKTIVSDY